MGPRTDSIAVWKVTPSNEATSNWALIPDWLLLWTPTNIIFMPHRESWGPKLAQASADTVGDEDKEGLASKAVKLISHLQWHLRH